MHSTLALLKINISIRKRQWLTSGETRCHYGNTEFPEKPPFKFVQSRKKYLQFVFSHCLRERKMSATSRLFPPFGGPWPSCLLPSHSPLPPPFFRRIMLSWERGCRFCFITVFELRRGVVPKLVRQHIFLVFILRIFDLGAPNSSWRQLQQQQEFEQLFVT